MTSTRRVAESLPSEPRTRQSKYPFRTTLQCSLVGRHIVAIKLIYPPTHTHTHTYLGNKGIVGLK